MMKGSIGMVILIKQIQEVCPLYSQLPILICPAGQSYQDIRSFFLLTLPPASEGDWTFFINSVYNILFLVRMNLFGLCVRVCVFPLWSDCAFIKNFTVGDSGNIC